jgi:hypothetical protein
MFSRPGSQTGSAAAVPMIFVIRREPGYQLRKQIAGDCSTEHFENRPRLRGGGFYADIPPVCRSPVEFPDSELLTVWDLLKTS